MKILLSWVFDHIDTDGHSIAELFCRPDFISHLIDRLGSSTAEIDSYEKIERNPEDWILATYKNGQYHDRDTGTIYHVQEKDHTIEGLEYLLKRDNGLIRRARGTDVQSTKEHILSAVWVPEKDISKWRERAICAIDYRLIIDNKAITNRPDLWCHRGFAREIVALMGMRLRSLEELEVQIPVRDETHEKLRSAHAIEIAPDCDFKVSCATFAISDIAVKNSVPWMALRLLQVDARPINSLIDVMNYTMFDMGQPLHAYDAARVQGGLVIRTARTGEKLDALDGTTISLLPTDLVIADHTEPLALAGIMGGVKSSVTDATRSIVVESVYFIPEMIRRSATAHKLRTEASARFEKDVSNEMLSHALMRVAALLQEIGSSYSGISDIVGIGLPTEPRSMELSHGLIERTIGISIESDFIKLLLERFEFKVLSIEQTTIREDACCEVEDCTYIVQIPACRGMRDIDVPEALVEEIVRLMGYDTIPHELPAREGNVTHNKLLFRMRTIKEFCAYGLQMQEVYNYALYDEEFVKDISLPIAHAVSLRNPVSEHWSRLVTSLMPHLFKNLTQNPDQKILRFFEYNAIWQSDEQKLDNKPIEKRSFALLFYESDIDFYEGKRRISRLADMLRLSLQWKTATEVAPWYDLIRVSELWVGSKRIGIAGMIRPSFMAKLHTHHTNAFGAELDATFLLEYESILPSYIPISKYPSVERDISLLVPYSVHVGLLEEKLHTVDARIESVILKDMFERSEWHDTRALTFRLIIGDKTGTLTSDLIDIITGKVVACAKSLGAVVR